MKYLDNCLISYCRKELNLGKKHQLIQFVIEKIFCEQLHIIISLRGVLNYFFERVIILNEVSVLPEEHLFII